MAADPSDHLLEEREPALLALQIAGATRLHRLILALSFNGQPETWISSVTHLDDDKKKLILLIKASVTKVSGARFSHNHPNLILNVTKYRS